jgi:hypothetical protein
MAAKAFTSLLAGGLVLAVAVSAGAQSLGDVAKKEEERRKAIPAGKVYTNKDLKQLPPPAGDDSAAAAKAGDDTDKSADPAKSDKTDKTDKAANPEKAADDKAAADKGGAKDQKYWHDRIEGARTALDRDTGYADAMQTRINALTTDFVNRDDPNQRSVIEKDRQRALAELERLRKQIVDDQKAITNIEEEARRSGVPPGWLR